ncbi:sensor histidine kinase [Streptomyces sp. NPDC002156]
MSDAADQPESTSTEGPAGLRVPRVAGRVVLLATSGLLPMGVLAVVARRPGAVVGAVALAALFASYGLQLVHSAPQVRSLRDRFGGPALALQGGLALLPVVAFGFDWPGMFGLFAGSVPLVIGGAVGRVLGGLVVVGGAGVSGVVLQQGWRDWGLSGAATVAVGLAVYGITRLADLVVRAHGEREELAWRAVAQERRRFARDLHDLLGYSLSAIALKTDLAHRLVRGEPERALAELDGARDVAQQALADVRTVARGYRELSFTVEAESARSLLAAADIRASVDVRCEVPGAVGSVLATVLREGVTNLIRHSDATQCRIEVRDLGTGFIRFTLANDGVRGGREARDGRRPGGLGNLAERLTAVGGRLTVDTDERGWYRVTAEAPSEPTVDPGEHA